MQYIVLNLKRKAHGISSTRKGSMNACMGLVGFSTAKYVKSNCVRSRGWVEIQKLMCAFTSVSIKELVACI